jgi:hypothetical protein
MVPSVSVVPTPAKCLSVESPTGVPPWGGRPQTFSRSYFCSEDFPSRASSPRHSKPVEWRSRRCLFFLRPTHPPAKRRDLVSVSCPVSDVGLDLRSCGFSELRPYGGDLGPVPCRMRRTTEHGPTPGSHTGQ